jgi:hypothetical protein
MKFRITFDEWVKVYLPAFETNKEFTRLFNRFFTNEAFGVFGLKFLELKSFQKTTRGYYFLVVDPKLWMLAKIKYGI